MENNLRSILSKHGFTFSKSFGQNFLTDKDLLSDIVNKAGVKNSDTVLEIGCGAGALTYFLAKSAKKVVGYEIDERLKPVLSETLFGLDNVEIVFKNVLKEDFISLERKLGKDYIMVANLPYYITTDILTLFLEKGKNIKAMAIMVQKEVADRLAASVGTAEYGAITVAVNLRGSAKIIKEVPREMFTPVPNVDSAVVLITIEQDKFDADFDRVRKLVKCGFGNRRKMLVNNLMKSYGINRELAERLLTLSEIDVSRRGETLSAKDYVNLSKIMEENGL